MGGNSVGSNAGLSAVTNYTETNNNQQQNTNGPLYGQTAASVAGLTAGSGSTLTVNQESPQALQYAQTATMESIDAVQHANDLLAAVATSGNVESATQAEQALKAAQNALQTNAQAALKSFGSLALIIGGLALIGFVAYYYFKKGAK